VTLKATKKVSEGREVSLSLDSLLDKQYEEIVFYRKPGRWINVSFSQGFQTFRTYARPLGG